MTEPELTEQAPTTALENWKTFARLNVQELINKSETDPQELNFEEQEVKREQFDSGYADGMFVKGTRRRNGLSRWVGSDGKISTGMYINGKATGFCRMLFPDGAYYLGMSKDDKFDGYGKLVLPNGQAQEGLWEKNQFKG